MLRTVKIILILAAIIVLLILISASIGAARISINETVRVIGSYIPGINHFIDRDMLDPQAIAVISQIRLPRIFMALVVGIALASAGVIFQGLFRNPMADPICDRRVCRRSFWGYDRIIFCF